MAHYLPFWKHLTLPGLPREVKLRGGRTPGLWQVSEWMNAGSRAALRPRGSTTCGFKLAPSCRSWGGFNKRSSLVSYDARDRARFETVPTAAE